MSLPSARTQLKGVLSQLKLRWEQTTEHWDDPASRAFEKEFLVPVEPSVRSALAAMDQMAELLARARRDCE